MFKNISLGLHRSDSIWSVHNCTVVNDKNPISVCVLRKIKILAKWISSHRRENSFANPEKRVTKKFIVLYQRKGFWLLVFSLLFGFTEKCRSSKIPRGFLKVATGHIFMSRAKFHSSQQSRLKIFISHLMIHLGENVWFNINQTFYMRNFWPTLEFIFQI